MQLEQILNPELIFYNLAGSSKKRVLETVAHETTLVVPSIEANALFDGLIAREKLGSTGFGEGVAIPHCRIENCNRPIGILVKLETPVDFDAIDGKAVDLLFVLLAPQDANQDHLDILRDVAELLNQASFRNDLRACKSKEALFETALSYSQKSPAA